MMSVDILGIAKYSDGWREIKEYQYMWRFYNVLRNGKNEVGQHEVSPKFFVGEYEWVMELYFGGIDSDSEDYVSIRPCLLSNSKMAPECVVSITLSLLDGNYKEHFKQKLTRNRECSSEDCFKKFVKRDELLSSPSLMPNDELRLTCRFSYHVSSSENRNSVVTDTPLPTLQCRNALMRNYEKIFDDPDYSDFQFNVGTTKIKVHKCILSAQSPVFAAMFRNDMLEKAKNEADIEDVEVNVMRQLLRFVYVGEVEDIDEMADKLFIAADKYQVLQLKELCEEKLIEQLSIDNLHETLQFVDKFDTTILKDAAIKFIVSNSSKLRFMHHFLNLLQSLSSILLAKIIRALMQEKV